MDAPIGISAVVTGHDRIETAILDLATVLEGLVGDSYEIIFVTRMSRDLAPLEEVRARAPRIPLRVVAGETQAAGCDEAVFSLILIAAPDGQFDVRELNRLLEAIERGADMAAGYRPRRMDALVRRLERLGLKMHVDYAFSLLRRDIWKDLRAEGKTSCTDGLASIRRLGYHVHELPVSHRRPSIGTPLSTASPAV